MSAHGFWKQGNTTMFDIRIVKENHLKSITSTAMNPPDITSFSKNFKQISTNSINDVDLLNLDQYLKFF